MEIRDLAPWNWGRHNVPVHHQDAPAHPEEREDPLRALNADVNKAFENFWRTFESPYLAAHETEGTALRIDLAETDREIEVTAELPGIDENDIEVVLTQNTLTIKGEKRAERNVANKDYHLTERSYGAVQRSIMMPGGIEQASATAAFKNGVLTVTISKSPEAQSQAKRISVTRG